MSDPLENIECFIDLDHEAVESMGRDMFPNGLVSEFEFRLFAVPKRPLAAGEQVNLRFVGALKFRPMATG
jgi:hypothetical protein